MRLRPEPAEGLNGRCNSDLPLAGNIDIGSLLCETAGSDRNINQQPFNDRNRLGLGTKFDYEREAERRDAAVALTKAMRLGSRQSYTRKGRDPVEVRVLPRSPFLKSMWAWASWLCRLFWEQVIAGSSPAARILKLRDRGSLNRLRMVILRQTIRSPILLVFGWMDGLSNLKSIRISNPTQRGGDSQKCASRREPHLKGGN